ncbi:hypothetical protein SAMN06265348_111158 [Pedobacter westerhofensis]|uniref:DUF6249 domain-containing protein n=1 Tax=Pedobacter westerhofensis TaxID=425512 RepID=A0A521FFC5_9SPHI|nr:DUF6249 domain-containing protein [Pedobacter westerhofensis]SMO94250.1 hypothetical protein SAMN06265348_111158 [Pedobacter westerhofensis]
MDEITRDAIVSIGSFAAIFGVIYVYLVTRHRERMSMLEKGVPASPFNSIKYSNFLTLKYGMLLVGIAVGILMGHVATYHWGVSRSTAFLAMVFLFGGLSLVLNYMIFRNNRE